VQAGSAWPRWRRNGRIIALTACGDFSGGTSRCLAPQPAAPSRPVPHRPGSTTVQGKRVRMHEHNLMVTTLTIPLAIPLSPQSLPQASFLLAAKPLVHRVPIAEPRGHVAPGATVAGWVQLASTKSRSLSTGGAPARDLTALSTASN
jgi:hypothetical protein